MVIVVIGQRAEAALLIRAFIRTSAQGRGKRSGRELMRWSVGCDTFELPKVYLNGVGRPLRHARVTAG